MCVFLFLPYRESQRGQKQKVIPVKESYLYFAPISIERRRESCCAHLCHANLSSASPYRIKVSPRFFFASSPPFKFCLLFFSSSLPPFVSERTHTRHKKHATKKAQKRAPPHKRNRDSWVWCFCVFVFCVLCFVCCWSKKREREKNPTQTK